MHRHVSKHERRSFLVAAFCAFTALCTPTADANGYLTRPEVRSFIGDLHAEYGLDPAELERILGEARYQPSVVRLIGPERAARPTPPVRSYPAYRARFLTKARIAAGVQYWNLHEADLHRAQAEFGVPAEIILGILGVETAFGQNTGSFRVVDALATIAFDGLRRQDYFRDELKQFLLLAREIGLDPLAVKGSYAGAMGLPQFMPSSYRQFAVDFDGNGLTDLRDSPSDAIGSIASYLKSHGWTSGRVAVANVKLPAGMEADLVSGLQRAHSVGDLRSKGVKFAVAELPEESCSIVELPAPKAKPKYLAGFGNFEAITRYNRSTFYATAVLDLAEAIREARDGQITASASADNGSAGR